VPLGQIIGRSDFYGLALKDRLIIRLPTNAITVGDKPMVMESVGANQMRFQV
jgi:hypothetical protein